MKNESVLGRIEQLAEEEQRLYRDSDLDADAKNRLASVETELDQCWDLLRRRRARQEFGDDPDQEQVRSAETVENYEQ